MKRLLLTGLLMALWTFVGNAQTLYDDFETTPGGTRLVTYRPVTGGTLIQNQMNPAATGINTSPTVARYQRSADTYDNFDIETPRMMADVTPYTSNTKRITMKFYSPAVGTQVLLVLQNKTKNRSGGYPAGKYMGEFTANTTVANAWETLTFTFNATTPTDGTVTSTMIDEITVLIAPNSNGTAVYHFDDIRGPELVAPATTAPVADDFETIRTLAYTDATGTPSSAGVFTLAGGNGTFMPGAANPSTTGNASTVVGRYVRSALPYATLALAPLNATYLDNISAYASTTATVHPAMKFYSPAANTAVQLVFYNKAKRTAGGNAYPTGTHSLFTATAAAVGWQTLSFNYVSGSYDATVKATEIDGADLQIAPNTTGTGTYYIDDIALPPATMPVAQLYENFKDVRMLTYGAGDGVLTQNFANPNTTGIDPNPLVGKYVRSAVPYDTFYANFPINATADDITDFVNGTRKLTMKVYAPAAGLPVTITLLDATATPTNYPTGRNSYYNATTTVANAWETLTFTFAGTPTGGVSPVHNISGLNIQFNGGNAVAGTWYFDQLYGPNFTAAEGTVYDDFETLRNVNYVADGTLNQALANPSKFAANYSSTVAQYQRATAPYATINITPKNGKRLASVAAYASTAPTKYFYLKVYSQKAGVPIQLVLQNAAKAAAGYPNGNQSIFNVTTTKSNQWELLRFVYQNTVAGTTDATVTATDVDQLALLFNPGDATAGQVYNFDFFVGQDLVTPPATAGALYDDFENNRRLNYGTVDGTFTPGIANPGSGGTNTSAVVGRYVRGSAQYATVPFSPANATYFNDITAYASATAAIKMTVKMYSPAAGTLVQLVLYNKAKRTAGGNAYPTGTHSLYTATTSAANTWQTLTFTYAAGSYDATVKATEIDGVDLQIAPNTNGTATYYIDDISLPATTMPVAKLYENFKDVRMLTYGAGDGVLTQNFANPNTTGIDPNPLVGKYVRSAVPYDTFYANFPINATADDITDFVNGTRKLTMKVYAPAAGLPVTITLLDATATPTNYPTGRNSYYNATTTVANAWETLTFTFAGTPTGGVNPVHNISGLNIQFNGGNAVAGTWYFDQLYGPNFTAAPGTVYDDFETSRNLTYTPDGTLTQNFANPSVFAANYSSTVAKYDRAAAPYATVKIIPSGGKRLASVAAYASATPTKYFYLKVFSQRIGTPVQLVLQNATKAATGYPNGNQSIFNATTTKSNEWETLQFAYQAANPGVSTDNTVSVNQVNQFALIFNPGDATAGQTYYFDFFVGQDLILATGLTWNGSVSSDWNDGDNWSGGTAPVAVSGAPATIPGGLARYPILTAGNTYGSPDIIINAGGSLTQTGGTLNLANGVTNNGTYSQTGGITNLIGNGSHVFGNGNPMLFYDLNVGTGGMALSGGTNGTVSVKHRMVVAGPVTMNASGKLILLSDATGTAMVVNRGTGAVTGNVVVQHYIDGSLNSGVGYRHLASPVVGPTVTDLHMVGGAAPVVNPAYNTDPNPYAVTPFPTVFTYNEQRITAASATSNDFSFGWQSPAALTDALATARGYTVNLAPGTFTLTGTLRNGNQTVALSRGTTANSGWQLLGNPYPSPINWDSLAIPTGLDNALYTFRSNSQYGGAYQSYVNGVGPAGSNRVALGQAFFTRVMSGTPSLTFTNACRTVNYSNPVQYRGTADARPRLDLALTNAAGESDVLYVYQENGATTGFDGRYDALKVTLNGGQQPTLYQQVGSESFSIQGLPAGSQPVALALGVNAPVAGSFVFSAQQLVNFPATASVQLEDTQTGSLHDLRAGDYAVTLARGLHATRFVLHIYDQRALATATAHATAALLVYPNPAQAGTVVRLSNPAATGEVLSATGSVVGKFANGHVSTTGLAAGLYLLRNTATGERTKLVIQ